MRARAAMVNSAVGVSSVLAAITAEAGFRPTIRPPTVGTTLPRKEAPASGGTGHTRIAAAAGRLLVVHLVGLALLSLAVLAIGAATAKAGTAEAADLGAVYVLETGHHLRLGFLDYWRRNQGPQRLGLPLSEEYWSAVLGAVVQHFQHARLEWRPGDHAVREVPESLDVARAGALGIDMSPAPRLPGVADWTDALAPPAPQIGVSPHLLAQGRTVLVEVQTDDPAAPLTVYGGFGTPGGASDALRYVPAPGQAGSPNRFVALAAAAMDRPLGDVVATAVVRNGLGLESPPQAIGLLVVDGEFPHQQVRVAAQLLPLLDPQVRLEERLTLAAVLAESAPQPYWRGPFQLPVAGPLTTRHGARRTSLDAAGTVVATGQHAGIDIAAPAGTAVVAPAGGVVAFAGRWHILGNVVVLDHGASVHSVYAHLSRFAVLPGQTLTRGQTLGYVGSTGLSTGPHLHWEIRVLGIAVDPLEWTRRAELGLLLP